MLKKTQNSMQVISEPIISIVCSRHIDSVRWVTRGHLPGDLSNEWNHSHSFTHWRKLKQTLWKDQYILFKYLGTQWMFHEKLIVGRSFAYACVWCGWRVSRWCSELWTQVVLSCGEQCILISSSSSQSSNDQFKVVSRIHAVTIILILNSFQ